MHISDKPTRTVTRRIYSLSVHVHTHQLVAVRTLERIISSLLNIFLGLTLRVNS